MQKTKKIKAGELLIKLREAVIKLIEQTKEIKTTTDALAQRVARLEKKVAALEKKIASGTPVPEVPRPTTAKSSSGSIEDLELEDLAKEIGIDLSPVKPELEEKAPQSIPAPPAPPPIGELGAKPKKIEAPPVPKPKPKKSEMDLLPTEDLLGVKQAGEEEIEKEKDELIRALKELDEL